MLFLITAILVVLLGVYIALTGAQMPGMLGQQVLTLVTVTLTVILSRRFLDRRSFSSLGLTWKPAAIKDLLWGILISGGMMGLIYLLEWWAGWLHFGGYAWEGQGAGPVRAAAAEALLVFVIIGWDEELLSRGYHLQNLAEGTNLLWGVLLSSAIFAILHAVNPNFSFNALAGLFLSGLFLAFGYVRTRQLWLPIGLHIGWNFFEGVVFGFPVSGLADFPRLLLHSIDGPPLVTGGVFGPEAGLILLPALLVGAACLYWVTRGRTWPSASP
ncbi:MAG: CPBP family intramembrane metalloprotease [Anaerolineales bacterium]|nr:CPBP family intramembrane metalloprotease [Anaerolineales bacterium]